MEIKVGQKVRSYDFGSHKDCYVEGIVEKIGPWEGCAGTCPHYHIRTTRKVWLGKEEQGETYYFPPVGQFNFVEPITEKEPK